MSKKLSIEQRQWVEDGGSIYTADEIEMVVDFDKRRIKVRESVAFNVGVKLARHIVRLHNQSLGINQFTEFLSGNPERFHTKA